MAASPRWKVYFDGEYIASCKYPEEAGAVAAMREGTEIRSDHSPKSVVWVEGSEVQSAGESYDFVAQTCYERIRAQRSKTSHSRLTSR